MQRHPPMPHRAKAASTEGATTPPRRASAAGISAAPSCVFFASSYALRMTAPRASTRAADAERLREQAQGRESESVVVSETLSAQQAAALLGVSRPHLTMLLDQDRIPYQTTAGGHRRIRRSDIEAYRESQQLAHAAMRESMHSTEELADDE